jgi:hypothetical protein
VVLGFTSTGKPIYQPSEMRRLGTHVIGAPGGGKSRLAENILRQDFLEMDGVRRGVICLDPHGTLASHFMNWYVSHGLHGLRPVRLLRAGDDKRVFHLNPLRKRPGVDPAVIASAVVNAVLRVWGGADPTATPQLRETLKCAFCALVELGLPITDAGKLLDLTDSTGLRAYATRQVSNPVVRQFFQTLDALRIAERDAKVGSAVRRLNEFLLPDRVRLIFSAPDRAIDWREIMDRGEFVILDLSFDGGRLSEDEAQVIGTMVLAEVFLASFGRTEDSIPAYIVVDECHRFLTEDVAKLFTEGRKFAVSPVLLHQTLGQARKAGDFIYSSIMAARTKVVFGGLEDDDASFMARNIFRGQFDLQKPKERYSRPAVVDQVPDWLLSESQSHGTAQAVGTNHSYGGSDAKHLSTTKNQSTTRSESDTASESDTSSESHTDSESVTHSASVTQSNSGSSSESTSHSEASDRSDSTPRQFSDSISDGQSTTEGEAETRGIAHTHGTADTYGHAHTRGTAHTSGVAVTEGVGETKGTTRTSNWSRGSSVTDTENRQRTEGRSQTLRSVFQVLPTASWSLAELIHIASVRLAHLGQGEAIIKIGTRPPTRIQTVHVRDGWASSEHIERIAGELAAAAPYVVSVDDAVASYRHRGRELLLRMAMERTQRRDHVDDPDERVTVSQLKDEGWG